MFKPKDLIGRTIKSVGVMNREDMEEIGWTGNLPPVVLGLDSGDFLFASQDEEGNGPGELFITTENGVELVYFMIP